MFTFCHFFVNTARHLKSGVMQFCFQNRPTHKRSSVSRRSAWPQHGAEVAHGLQESGVSKHSVNKSSCKGNVGLPLLGRAFAAIRDLLPAARIQDSN